MLRRSLPLGILLLCLALAWGMLVAFRQQEETARIQEFREAYPDLTSLPDFEYITRQADGSFLLQTPGEPAQSAFLPQSIADMLAGRELLGLRKCGDDLFFITSGAADDALGYVISGDAQVDMDGLWQLDRVDGQVYRFSTWKQTH